MLCCASAVLCYALYCWLHGTGIRRQTLDEFIAVLATVAACHQQPTLAACPPTAVQPQPHSSAALALAAAAAKPQPTITLPTALPTPKPAAAKAGIHHFCCY